MKTHNCHWCKKEVSESEKYIKILEFVICQSCNEEQERQQALAYEQLAEEEEKIRNENNDLLNSIGRTAEKWLNVVLDGCSLQYYQPLSIVDKPYGENQNEKCGIFKEIWVEQWSTGMEGDSYEGYIYAKFDADKWLKIPYYC